MQKMSKDDIGQYALILFHLMHKMRMEGIMSLEPIIETPDQNEQPKQLASRPIGGSKHS